ncbi:MAG: hypothetical protein GXP58_03055 [Deltaproteobacteria bacterium]|nr:hypothetical protein [Deltaproteobacteria bacterium]
MALEQILDREVFGVAIRTIARVVVLGGIVIILLRKGLRKIRNSGNRSGR